MLAKMLTDYCFPKHISEGHVEQELDKFLTYKKLFDYCNRSYVVVKDNEIILCFNVNGLDCRRNGNNYVHLTDCIKNGTRIILWEDIEEFEKIQIKENKKLEKQKRLLEQTVDSTP